MSKRSRRGNGNGADATSRVPTTATARLAEGGATAGLPATPDTRDYSVSAASSNTGGSKARTITAAGKTITLQDLRKALNEDWLVRRALRIGSNIVLSLIGEYEHPNLEIRDFVRGAIRYAARTWYSAQLSLLEAQWMGCGLLQMVWETDPSPQYAGKWLLKELRPIPPESVYPDGMDMAKGLHQEWIYQSKGKQDEVKIPGYQVVHWAHESASDPFGNPWGRNLYMLSEGGREMLRLWLTGLENVGQPLLKEITGKGNVKDPATGKSRSRVDVAKEAWDQSQGGSVIIREAANDDGSLPIIDAIKMNGWDEEFKGFAGYRDRGIMLGLGVLPLLVMEPEHATRAQATAQVDVQQVMSVPLAMEMSTGVMVDQLAKPLVYYNFGEQETYGEFPVRPQVDEEGVAQIIESLGRVGAIHPEMEAYYEKLQEQFPALLPTVEQIGAEGFAAAREATPAGVVP